MLLKGAFEMHGCINRAKQSCGPNVCHGFLRGNTAVVIGACCTDTLSSRLVNVLKKVLRVLCCATQGALPLPQHFTHSETLFCVCV